MLTILLLIGFIAAWVALYFFVIRPKLEQFRYTAGIYGQLEAWEAGAWSKIMLRLKGLKVAIIGLVTSSGPVLLVLWDQITGLDWSKFLSDDRAKIVVGVIAFVSAIGPVIMVFLHQGAIADAAALEPKQE